ncbi:NUDIX hydrolase [Neolewinella sp.]|uniref:NUDIX hydrolase n=1 Tax=Neolewinella sp. TaxID=2993543 RepID=UPI003B52B04B
MDGSLSTRVTAQSPAATHTVDCVVFGFAEGELRVLLVRRAVEPFAGQWVLPGGAMAADQTLEDTGQRVLRELVGVSNLQLTQVATYSAPDRHPVRRVVTTTYYALVRPEHHTPVARGYLSEAAWHRLTELPPLGFDHRELLDDAWMRLTVHLRTRPLAFALLPDDFTLSEVQQLYEEILGEPLDRRNFRRKVLAYDFLIDTGAKRSGVKGGPAVYRSDAVLLQRALATPHD